MVLVVDEWRNDTRIFIPEKTAVVIEDKHLADAIYYYS